MRKILLGMAILVLTISTTAILVGCGSNNDVIEPHPVVGHFYSTYHLCLGNVRILEIRDDYTFTHFRVINANTDEATVEKYTGNWSLGSAQDGYTARLNFETGTLVASWFSYSGELWVQGNLFRRMV